MFLEWVVWVARAGVVLEVEVEADLDEEAHLLHPTHTALDQPRDLGHQLRLAGEGSTVRGRLHTRGVDQGAPNPPRVEEAEDDTRRNTTGVAARVVTAMEVAIAEAEVDRETAGPTAEQPNAGFTGRITLV